MHASHFEVFFLTECLKLFLVINQRYREGKDANSKQHKTLQQLRTVGRAWKHDWWATKELVNNLREFI